VNNVTGDSPGATSDAAREQVRHELARNWRESVSVIHFYRRRFSYSVPGRKQNGQPATTSTAVRVLRTIAIIVFVVVFAAVFLVLVLVEAALNVLNLELPLSGPLSKHGKLSVKGEQGSPAVRLADAARDSDRTLWIAWSHSRMALVGSDAEPPFRVLWSTPIGQRPKLKSTETSLTWPDGSTVTFEIDKRERALIRARNGRP
jgi:hypothetical protein